MAILKNITSGIGVSASYHRIRSVEYDFDQNAIHIYIASYAEESYRQDEKDTIAEVEEKIQRYYSLISAESLTEEEMNELQSLDICELEAYRIESKVMGTMKYTVSIGQDVRPELYTNIVSIIPDFSDGGEI